MTRSLGPGDVFLGKYRIERVLGQGGMGMVVAARHVDLGQLYAIKLLLPTVLSHHEALERFVREARAAALLKSEHVARVHDVGQTDDGAPYMIMEHLDGRDLKAVVSQDGPLPADVAMTYLAHVCDAIAEAHAAGIVHRDLKPANLFLVRRRNGTPCVKVLDFGISKHLGAEDVDLTGTHATLGSPLYMSPEQISKSKSVDTRTDIWALGVILYELLTGLSPFRGGTMLEVVSRILQEEPTPIRELRPDIPPHAEMVIARCLRKRREERFQTVEELLDVLEGRISGVVASPMMSTTNTSMVVVGNSVAQPSPPLMSERTGVAFGQTGARSPARRAHSLVLMGGIAMAVLLVGGTIVGLRQRFVSTNEPTPAVAPIASHTAVGVHSAGRIEEPAPTIDTAAAPNLQSSAESVKNDAPKVLATDSIAAKKAPALGTAAPTSATQSGSPPKKKRSVL